MARTVALAEAIPICCALEAVHSFGVIDLLIRRPA